MKEQEHTQAIEEIRSQLLVEQFIAAKRMAAIVDDLDTRLPDGAFDEDFEAVAMLTRGAPLTKDEERHALEIYNAVADRVASLNRQLDEWDALAEQMRGLGKLSQILLWRSRKGDA